MTKFEKLIKDHCPNGVEFVPLGEVCSLITKGTTPSVFEKSGISFVKTEAFDGTRIDKNKLSFINEHTHNNELKRSILQLNDILFAIAGTIGKCALVTEDILPANTNQALAIIRLTNNVNRNYILHVFQSEQMKEYIQKSVKSSAQPNLNLQQMNNFIIPFPPLVVQEEIAFILDKYTIIETELEKELQLELEARKKQYEYYRNELLTFNINSDIMNEAEIRNQKSEIRNQKSEIRNQKSEIRNQKSEIRNRRARFLTLGEIAEYSQERIAAIKLNNENYIGVDNLLQDKRGKTLSSYVPNKGNFTRYDKGDILIGNIRPYLRKIWKANAFGGTNGDVLVIKIKDKQFITSDYLYYLLSSDEFFNYDMQYSKGAKMPRGNKQAVMNYQIPVPSLEEQEKIVDILDRFETLTNDLTNGLPAEIVARKKQYEYYRDRLLTF